MRQITMVRLYLSETEEFKQRDEILNYLKELGHVQGMTIFRGIRGYGRSGIVRHRRWFQWTSDLPVVIEFFDDPDKVAPVLLYLTNKLAAGHIVHWTAYVNE